MNLITKEASGFDYSAIGDQEVAGALMDLAADGRKVIQDSYLDAIAQLGRILSEANELLAKPKHGSFVSWSTAEFGLTKSTVYRYMNVWRRLLQHGDGEYKNWSPSALYLLAELNEVPPDVHEQLQQLPSVTVVRPEDVERVLADNDEALNEAARKKAEQEAKQAAIREAEKAKKAKAREAAKKKKAAIREKKKAAEKFLREKKKEEEKARKKAEREAKKEREREEKLKKLSAEEQAKLTKDLARQHFLKAINAIDHLLDVKESPKFTRTDALDIKRLVDGFVGDDLHIVLVKFTQHLTRLIW
jgi:flagellar biosynthesis GTPase FlhF